MAIPRGYWPEVRLTVSPRESEGDGRAVGSSLPSDVFPIAFSEPPNLSSVSSKVVQSTPLNSARETPQRVQTAQLEQAARDATEALEQLAYAVRAQVMGIGPAVHEAVTHAVREEFAGFKAGGIDEAGGVPVDERDPARVLPEETKWRDSSSSSAERANSAVGVGSTDGHKPGAQEGGASTVLSPRSSHALREAVDELKRDLRQIVAVAESTAVAPFKMLDASDLESRLTLATRSSSAFTAFVDQTGQSSDKIIEKKDINFGLTMEDMNRLLVQDVMKLLPPNRLFIMIGKMAVFLMNVKEPERSGALHHILSSKRFALLCNLVIWFNAIFAAYLADWEVKNLNTQPTRFIVGADIFFLCFYSSEMLLRLTVHQRYFFCNQEWRWNLFDLLLVCLSAYEQVMATVGAGGDASSITFMRIFRIFKVVKVLRLVRALRVFQELRIMMYSVFNTITALFWALVFITVVIYVVGLVLLQGVTRYLSEDPDPTQVPEIMDHFGSMSATMLSLYKVSTGGDDWSVAYDSLVNAGDMYALLFLFFIAFFQFAVMNILTGMIVESVAGLANEDADVTVLEYRRKQMEVVEEARQLFETLDTNHSGSIEQREFDKGLESEEVHALMAAIDLDDQDARMFFEELKAASGQEAVSTDAFIDGCTRMKGHASAIDMQCALAGIRSVQQLLLAGAPYGTLQPRGA